MKRGLAIPCGLLLFGLAVAPLFHSRPAAPPGNPSKNVAVVPSTIEVAQNDDYLPPLLGIYDENELATPGPFGSLATVSFDQPSPLPEGFLRHVAWPSARPDILQTVGYDNPLPTPFSATPKIGGSGTGGSTTIIPDLFDNQPPINLAGPAATPITSSRPTENLIRPKPLAIDNPGSMVRIQGEPPLAGSQPLPLPSPVTPTPVPAGTTLVPTPAMVHPTPATLGEYTGCGCEPRVGTGYGFSNRIGHAGDYAHQTPLCCQSFSSCCRTPICAYQVNDCSSCCPGESHWRPFAKIKGWFRKDQKGCGPCVEDCCVESCGTSRKPFFGKFRGLFQKFRGDDCAFVEPCEVNCGCGSVIVH